MDTEPDPDNRQVAAEPPRRPPMVPVAPDKTPRCIAKLQDCREPCHLTAAWSTWRLKQDTDLRWTGQGCSETEDIGYYGANGPLI